jgi:hypothetical protein
VAADVAGALARGGVHVLVAPSERSANVELHARLHAAVALAVTASVTSR